MRPTWPERRPSTPSHDAEADTTPRSRRRFLRDSVAMVGGAVVASAVAPRVAGAAPLPIPESELKSGRTIPPAEYGMPSKFEANVLRRRTDVFVNRQNLSDWSMTPLQHQLGIVTPNGLFFERHHAGVADIDPRTHRLVIHGMVKQPLVFTMDDLLRYPSVSRFHFLECSGNTLADWLKVASTTVQQTHGLLSGAQWTGIPASWLLNEAGLQPGSKWVLFEGADGATHTRSIPLDKALDDVLIVYGQNGEMLRPEQGYPLRVLIPGWEGNVSVKWLRRIKVSDQPWYFRSETARYTDPMPGGKWRIVSVDGGKNWQEAALEGPALDKMLTRFRYRWNWNGGPTTIASRAMDSTGYVQPTVDDIKKVRAIAGFVQHHNGIFPWSVSANGEVKNAIA